ncbi:MAG TPA: CHASE3 domain-containing protein [Ohtaekwangia sp.]
MKPDRISVLLTASIALTVVSAVITHYAIEQSRDRVEWVLHTHLVIGQSTNLLSVLKDAESSQRGYILSADSTYLQPYREAEQRIPLILDSLQVLVSDNSQQSALLKEKIIPIANRRIARMREVLKLYDDEGLISARMGLKTNEGKKLMDELRETLNAFGSTETLLLNERLREVARTHKQQNMIRFVSFSIIGIVSALALIALQRAQRQNEELLTQLQAANRNLEEKVQERTLELERKNELNEKLNHDLRENFEELESFYEILQHRFERTQEVAHEILDLYNNPLCGYHSLNADGIIIRMNKTELDWLGYTAEEVLNKMHVTQILVESDHQSYLDGFPSFKKQGFVKNKEHTFKRKDGSTFQVLLNSTAIYDRHGNFVMSRGTLIDITDRKIIEQKLLTLNQNLLHLNEEKNNFLAIAAHDLRSPINGILGLINLIKYSGHNLTDEQRSYCDHIQQSCSNMQTLITNLLDINRIEKGLNSIKAESVNIRSLIENNMLSFKEIALQKDILIHVEDLTSAENVHTDPVALTRILDNLVSNAIKFSPKGKTVGLKISNTSAHLRIDVTDQGPGIAPDEHEKLFRKFQKLSARPTNGESSTGLGLSIVKELTEALGGRISVTSEPNQGSTFTLILPIHHRAA